ncbi:metallophosphoesterase family protein [soil metagenome]
MRYAIFGDIHANWEALMTVMGDAQEQGCTHFVCLGDVVGYNANPGECLDYVRALNCPVVKGNHDEEATQDRSLDDLNPLAESALLWTRRHLTDDQKQWLRELKLVRQARDFTIVHATLDSPGSWAYVSNRFDAMASFSYQFTQICFYGHTHTPRIYEKDDTVRCLRETDVVLRRGVKYFINVGSVGQPRDGDWRSSYAVYDVEKQTVNVRRLEYDLHTAQQKILDVGLPPVLAERLALGR